MSPDINPVLSFRLRGIPVQIDRSLAFLLLLIVLLAGGLQNPMHGVILAAMLLSAIFLHEMGHAWAARVQGLPVRRVVLWGGGGFCEYPAALPRKASGFVTAMGPVVNLALWTLSGLAAWGVLAWLAAQVGTGSQPPGSAYLTGFKLTAYLIMFAQINLALFAFNMVPVQPLDGGKLLEHTLRRWMDGPAASRMAGWVGLVASALWLPGMVALYVTMGWVLFFIPSIRYHWLKAQGKMP